MAVAGASRALRGLRGLIQTIGAIVATPMDLDAALTARQNTPARSPETIKGFEPLWGHIGGGRRHGVLMCKRHDVGT